MAKNYPKVKYEINMVEVLERAMADRPRQVRDKLRGLMGSALFKQKFGENVIDKIAERTEKKRIDKNGKPFKAPYSRAYQKSDIFSIYGKTPNKVNLKLTGEMLASMKVGKSGSLKLKIIMADKINNDKAHGHINGIKRLINQNEKVRFKKGKRMKRKTQKVKRDFLGLPPEDEIAMMKKTIRDFNAESLEILIDFEKPDLEFGATTTQIEAASETVEGPTEIIVTAGVTDAEN